MKKKTRRDFFLEFGSQVASGYELEGDGKPQNLKKNWMGLYVFVGGREGATKDRQIKDVREEWSMDQAFKKRGTLSFVSCLMEK